MRAARFGRRWTQRELAAAVDRSVRWVSRVERGQSALTLLDLERLTGALGISVTIGSDDDGAM